MQMLLDVTCLSCVCDECFELFQTQHRIIKSNQNQIKIYIAPYVHEDSEALGGWITCSRHVGIDESLNVF